MSGGRSFEGVGELRVVVTARDFDRLSDFYRIGLGLEPAAEWPSDQGRSLVLDLGRATLEVFDERQAETVDAIEAGRRMESEVRFALRVPDLDTAISRLAAHGTMPIHEPVRTPWGDRNVRYQDSEGMPITLFESEES